MRIAINLASRPFADLGPALKRLRIGMGVLALVAIALGFGLHALSSKADLARARQQLLDRSINTVRQEQQGYQALMRQPENALVLAQSETLNRLFDEKGFSWTLAMEDLETVLPGGVQIMTLEPIRDKKDAHITLRMHVVGPRDREVELVQNLEHSRRFLLPRIVGESSESTGNGGANERVEPVSASNRMSFEILADYNPAKPGERKAAKKAGTEQEAPAANATPEARPRAPLTANPGLRRPNFPAAQPQFPQQQRPAPRQFPSRQVPPAVQTPPQGRPLPTSPYPGGPPQ